MYPDSLAWLLAGVVVILAFFALVGYVARVLRATRRLPAVIIALGTLIGVLPTILYAMYHVAGTA
ncbi:MULTISPECIES: hypothetical protein [Streptomyces]|uniref:hypothetical protein n=1 Tax=Streptomyces TaxID=1883 RepID=UPI00168B194A|nr:hypothetical protein [Streptomyces sp. 5-10]MBD3008317.1 hypothetical protein [Streptomyces sp. 5-10]MBI0379199.1 hypothetical protein [Streptomyces albiflaviniger]